MIQLTDINEGVRKVTLGFRWESEAQHHIPTIEIEFEPVSPDSPNDAKGWKDRDRLAAILSPDATWLPVPDKHPTFDPVDLQLADGSVLCGCVPQSDGDYWWEGPSGEVFIDPRYAPVTHWRLSAAPEAKP